MLCVCRKDIVGDLHNVIRVVVMAKSVACDNRRQNRTVYSV